MLGPYESGRVYVGDSLLLAKAIPDRSVVCIWTDPPYGCANQHDDLASRRARASIRRSRAAEPEEIKNDRPEDYEALLRGYLTEAARVLAPDGAACTCVGGGGPVPMFADLVRYIQDALTFDHAVVWNKRIGGPGMGWVYRRCYEFVMVAHRKGGTLRHPDAALAIDNVQDFAIVKDQREKLHPNQKPTALIAQFLALHTAPGDLVLDPFAGSGSTGVAAIHTGREFIGFELDPVHAAVANDRLEAARRGQNLASYRSGQGSLWGGGT